jgi:hypothetical protein
MEDSIYKFCIIGVPDELVQKFLDKYTRSQRSEESWIVGVDIRTKRIEIREIKVKLIIVAVSSVTYLDRIRKTYYEGGYGVMFMYDREKPDSIESIDQHIRVAQQVIGNEGIYRLVGVETGKNLISTTEGQQLAQKMDIDFSEIKENDQRAFTKIVANMTREILEREEVTNRV